MNKTWEKVVQKAHGELLALKNLEIDYGPTISIATRIIILEEALKLYEEGYRDIFLYNLLLGSENETTQGMEKKFI